MRWRAAQTGGALAVALPDDAGRELKDFGATEEFVGVVAGIGAAIAGVFGALLVPPIVRILPVDRAYLAIGAVGAVFTLVQILLPSVPATFPLCMIGQNDVQTAALAAVNVVVLRSMPKTSCWRPRNSRCRPLRAA